MPLQDATNLKVIGERELAPIVYDPLGDEAGQAVRTCDKLSAADKIAWAYLRTRSGSGREQITITPAEVGHYEGRTADAGRARLSNLKDAGLIHVLFTCPKTKRVTIVVLDPLTVLTSRVAFVPADPQRVLPFAGESSEPAPALHAHFPAAPAHSESSAKASLGDAPSGAAQTRADGLTTAPGHPPFVVPPRNLGEEAREDPPEEPRRGTSGGSSALARADLLHSGHSVPESVSRPLTFSGPSGPLLKVNHPQALGPEEPRRGTSGGTSAEEQLEAELAQRQREQGLEPASAIGQAVRWRVPTEEDLAEQRAAWQWRIKQAVNDPRLMGCVLVKVAWAVVSGELPGREVDQVLAELAKHRRNGTLRTVPSAYFIGGIKRLFARHELDWTGYAHGGRRKPKPR